MTPLLNLGEHLRRLTYGPKRKALICFVLGAAALLLWWLL